MNKEFNDGGRQDPSLRKVTKFTWINEDECVIECADQDAAAAAWESFSQIAEEGHGEDKYSKGPAVYRCREGMLDVRQAKVSDVPPEGWKRKKRGGRNVSCSLLCRCTWDFGFRISDAHLNELKHYLEQPFHNRKPRTKNQKPKQINQYRDDVALARELGQDTNFSTKLALKAAAIKEAEALMDTADDEQFLAEVKKEEIVSATHLMDLLGKKDEKVYKAEEFLGKERFEGTTGIAAIGSKGLGKGFESHQEFLGALVGKGLEMTGQMGKGKGADWAMQHGVVEDMLFGGNVQQGFANGKGGQPIPGSKSFGWSQKGIDTNAVDFNVLQAAAKGFNNKGFKGKGKGREISREALVTDAVANAELENFLEGLSGSTTAGKAKRDAMRKEGIGAAVLVPNAQSQGFGAAGGSGGSGGSSGYGPQRRQRGGDVQRADPMAADGASTSVNPYGGGGGGGKGKGGGKGQRVNLQPNFDSARSDRNPYDNHDDRDYEERGSRGGRSPRGGARRGVELTARGGAGRGDSRGRGRGGRGGGRGRGDSRGRDGGGTGGRARSRSRDRRRR